MAVRLRLLLVWGLFIAWVSWLGWQAYFHGRFPVVSRSQMLNADAVIIAELTTSDQDTINIQDVVWPDKAARELVGKTIRLGAPRLDGFVRAGKYAIPVTRFGNDQFELAAIPRSPLSETSQAKHYVYPATPVVLEQIRRIPEHQAPR